MTTLADRYGLGEDFGIGLGDLACLLLPFFLPLAATVTDEEKAVRDDDLDDLADRGRRCKFAERNGKMIISTMCGRKMNLLMSF